MTTPIWYVFLHADGTYQGSGTPHYDDDTYGSTLVPVPEYGDGEQAVWDGDTWHVVPIEQ